MESSSSTSRLPVSARSRLMRDGLAHLREFSLVVILIGTFVVLSATTPSFFSYGNLITTVSAISLNAIMLVGMTVALVSGGFDLSVGAVFGATGMLVAYLLSKGMAIPVAIVLSLLFAMGWGVLNGLLIARLGINPLITTLGTLGMARGFAYILSDGSVIGGLEDGFTQIGQSSISVFGNDIPSFVIVALVIVIVGDQLLRRWVHLRAVYFLGGNEDAARLSGIRTDRVKFAVYVLTAFLAGVAGVLGTARFAAATPLAGNGVELNIIAAAVIGGASLSGGQGSVAGALLGLLLLGVVNSALVLNDVSVYWQQFIAGAILIVAVAMDRLLNTTGAQRESAHA